MKENRREFLQTGLAAAGAVGVGLGISHIIHKKSEPESAPDPLVPALTPEGQLIRVQASQAAPHSHHAHSASNPSAARRGEPGRKWVMMIDLAKCDGCKNCTTACNKMHHVPPNREWIRVFKMQDAEHTAPYWFPKPCFHCDNAPCTKVCPVDATFKRQDGVVLIDNERCIGCRFCMAACPYSTRVFNWSRPEEVGRVKEPYSPEKGFPRRVGTVEKCDFCPEMAKNGELPACVSNCSMGALYFGDQNEDAVTNSQQETERFSKLIEDRAGYRYLEELGTEPRVYYLPPKSREYPGPLVPKNGHHAP